MIFLRLLVVVSVGFTLCYNQVSGYCTTRFYNEFHFPGPNRVRSYGPNGYHDFGPPGLGFRPPPYKMAPSFGGVYDDRDHMTTYFHPPIDENNYVTAPKKFNEIQPDSNNVFDDIDEFDEMTMAASTLDETKIERPKDTSPSTNVHEMPTKRRPPVEHPAKENEDKTDHNDGRGTMQNDGKGSVKKPGRYEESHHKKSDEVPHGKGEERSPGKGPHGKGEERHEGKVHEDPHGRDEKGQGKGNKDSHSKDQEKHHGEEHQTHQESHSSKKEENIPKMSCGKDHNTDKVDMERCPAILSDIDDGKLDDCWVGRAYDYVSCLLKNCDKKEDNNPSHDHKSQDDDKSQESKTAKTNYLRESMYGALVTGGGIGEKYTEDYKHVPKKKDEKKSRWRNPLGRKTCYSQSSDTLEAETSPSSCKLQLRCKGGGKLDQLTVLVIDKEGKLYDFDDLTVRQKHCCIQDGLKEGCIYICRPAKVTVKPNNKDLTEIMVLKSCVNGITNRCVEKFFDTTYGQHMARCLCQQLSLGY